MAYVYDINNLVAPPPTNYYVEDATETIPKTDAYSIESIPEGVYSAPTEIVAAPVTAVVAPKKLTRKEALAKIAQTAQDAKAWAEQNPDGTPLLTNVPGYVAGENTDAGYVGYIPQETMQIAGGTVDAQGNAQIPAKPSAEMMQMTEDLKHFSDFVSEKRRTAQITPEEAKAMMQLFTQNYKSMSKAPTENEAILGSLKAKLGRQPTDQEFLDAKKQWDTEKKKAGEGEIPSLGNVILVSDESGKRPGAIEDLTTGQQEVIKKLTNYEIQLPSGMALKTPYWQGILERASAYDPTFDAKEYNVKMAVKRDFTSGKNSNNIKSLNTAIGHLAAMQRSGDALENFDFTPLNAAKNKTLNTIGDPRVRRFMTDAQAVAGELATVFKGTAGTDQEIKQWLSNITSSDSPEQIKASVSEAIELLGSRLYALRDQYEKGMGKPKDYKFLSKKSDDILRKLGADPDMLDPVSKSATPTNEQSKPSITQEEAIAELKRRGKL